MTNEDLLKDLLRQAERLPHLSEDACDYVNKRTAMLIRRIFGDSSPHLRYLHGIDYYPNFAGPLESHKDVAWTRGQQALVNLISIMLEEFQVFESARIPVKDRAIVFISHDGESPVRRAVELECFRIGLHPIVIEAQPSRNESVDDKVDRFLDQSKFAIVVAGFHRGSEQDGERYPRAAVIDEISRIRSKLGDRFIVLLEEGLRLPVTLSAGIVYEPYRADSYDRAILAVFKSLLENGVI